MYLVGLHIYIYILQNDTRSVQYQKLYTYTLNQQMHVTYYYLLYFNKIGNIISKTTALLENIKCNTDLFCHTFFYNSCALTAFSLCDTLMIATAVTETCWWRIIIRVWAWVQMCIFMFNIQVAYITISSARTCNR